MQVYYDNLAANNYPNTIAKVLSVNYYDTYPKDMPALSTLGFTQSFLSDNAQANTRSTKGLSVASYLNNIENASWTKNFTYYDNKGRAIATYSKNHLGGYTKTESFLDFSGAVQKTITQHKRRTTDAREVKIVERFVYDHQNRLLKHYHNVNDNPEDELLAENTYNELGQLTNKKVGGKAVPVTGAVISPTIQSVDFSYNIRGWMTGINLNPDKTFQNGKLFNYKINYNNTLEGLTNPNNEVPYPIQQKWNGNIAEVSWRNSGKSNIQRYGYVYDRLNRLIAGLYQNPLNKTSKEHSEMLTYDLNGNIKTLKRTSYFVGTAASLIDNLEYKNYVGNRVTSITDASDNGSGYEGGGQKISYDANGNMTDMPDKGIASISYNHLNLPVQMEIGESNSKTTIKNLYRSDGTKLKKENTTTTIGIAGSTSTKNETDYLDGFQYLSKTGSGDPGSTESLETDVAMEREAFTRETKPIPGGSQEENFVLQFFPTSEGFYDFENSKYIYQYKDHLGNVRISYTKKASGGIEIVDKNEYYPFGMNFLYSSSLSVFGDGSYKNYKYNGKELQETGMYDYGARMYMPDIGRWGVVDPLAEMYRRFSPYNYTVNNPINFTDPDGRWVRGAGFWNNITKSDARIHAEQASDRKNPQTGHYGTVVNKGDKKGTFEVTYHTSNFSYTDTYGSKGLVSSFSVGSAEGGGYGDVAPGTSAVDPWGSTMGPTPESRGKTDIQTMVSENPLVQGAVVDAVTGGIGSKLLGKLFPAVKAEVPVLEGAVESNFKRFVNKAPANAKASASYELLEDGNYLFQATSPGKVPGSSALYQKWVNPQGETFKMLKTTFAPDGGIIHVKPK